MRGRERMIRGSRYRRRIIGIPARGCPMLVTFVLALVVFCVLAFRGLGFLAWVAATGVWLIGWRIVGVDSPLLFEVTPIVLLALAILFGVPLVRRHLVSR